MQNNKCLCTDKQKKVSMFSYGRKQCCCQKYRNKIAYGNEATKNLWRIILDNTTIQERSGDIKTSFDCDCSGFFICSCCKESQRQYSLYKVEDFFHKSYGDNESSSFFLLNSLIEAIKSKNKFIEGLKKDLDLNIKKYEKQINGLEKELVRQKDIINHLQVKKLVTEKQVQEICLENAKKDNILQKVKEEENKLEQALKEKDSRIEKLLNKDKVLSDKRAYDFIIHIESLYDLMKTGWRLTYNVNDTITKEKIKSRLNNNRVLVGVIGYENVGKTHFLNKLCGDYLPHGYNYHTEGLSFKISENENLPFIFADAAGCGKPFSYYGNSYSFADKEKNLEEKSNIVNDRIMTETFIQDFILASCNIILIILGQLTQENQKMIERIIKHYYTKNIYIVHNFSNLAYVESVNEKIQRDIIEAFPVEEFKLVGYNDKNNEKYNEENVNQKQYIEKRKGCSISHLIYAREETEAGQFYNEKTIDSIKMSLCTEKNFKKFNLEESFNSFLCQEKLRSYLSLEKSDIKDLKIQEEEDCLRLNKKIEFKIKQGVFNAFGTLIIDNIQENEFDPAYRVYENHKKFTLFISIPGKMQKTSDKINLKLIKEDSNKGIQIDGNVGEIFKPVQDDDFVRKEGLIVGNFTKRILFCDSDKDFNFDKKELKYVEGVYIIEFPKVYADSKEEEI